MAQFSHADFGGMSQWSSGMSMVGDMFNVQLKAKLDALCTDLAPRLESSDTAGGPGAAADSVSYRSTRTARGLVAGRIGQAGRDRCAE